MSRATINKIIAKLERLDEYIKYLKSIQKVNKKSFVHDYHFYGLAERYLQLAIEVILDVGKLVIIARGLRRPEDNQDILIILGEEKIVPRGLVQRLTGIAQFRNILVHDYEKIDREIVYEKLLTQLNDFIDFKKAMIKFVR